MDDHREPGAEPPSGVGADEPLRPTPPSLGRFRRRLFAATPWVLSLGVVVFLFGTADLGAVAAAFARADLGAFLAVVAVSVSIMYVVDTLTLVLIFRRLVGWVSFRDMLAFKGVSHFGQALNFSAGAGTMAFLVDRKYGHGFLASSSAFLFQMATDVMALTILMTVGLAFGGEYLPEALRRGLLVPVVLLWCGSVAGVGFWLSGWSPGPLAKLRRWRVLEAFRRARAADYLAILGARLTLLVGYSVGDWAAVRTFGIATSIDAQQVVTALVGFMSAVPASISGLGALQPVMISLYSPYVIGDVDPYAVTLAFSTAFGPAVNIVRLGIAYAFLGSVSRGLREALEQRAQARAGGT